MKKRVVLLGAYGIESAGDDAPLLVLTERLRRAHPEVSFEFTVIARHPDPLIESLAGVRFLPNLEHESREAARGRWFHGLNPGDDTEHLGAVSREIQEADLVVAGAGNFLVDLTIDVLRGPVPLFATYAFLCDLHRTPFLLYGISAGPLATSYGRQLSSWMVRRSAAVTCRDDASVALLRELDPEARPLRLPDPVLGLRPAGDEEVAALFAEEGIDAETERPRLALALRDVSFLDFDRNVLVEALRELAADYELLFVPQCTYADGDDREEAERIARALPDATVHQVRGRHAPSTLMRVYETADATIAMRLHGAVFSALAGVPPVGIAYLPKVASFLEEFGLGELSVSLAGATPEGLVERVRRSRHVDAGQLVEQCRSAALGVDGYVTLASRLLRLTPASDAAA